jgi:ribonucleoside-diphosphate reductase beta chain
MTPKDIKKYVRFIADWRLGQLGHEADLHDRRSPAAVAGAAAERRRARQFLRTARDRIFEGGDARPVGRRLGRVRPSQGAQGDRAANEDMGERDMFGHGGVAAE